MVSLCVRTICECPEGTEGAEYMSEIIFSDLDESNKSIFWCKKTWLSMVPHKTGIPA